MKDGATMANAGDGHGPVCQVFHGAILSALQQSPRRFSDFRDAIPDISDRLLSERLKELEDANVVVREVSTKRPLQVLYRLTQKGEELQPVMTAIGTWAGRWAMVEAQPNEKATTETITAP
jgi:DNA-binding HxlR family transcriptional regulator